MKRRWWIVLGSTAFAAICLIVALSVFCGDPINQSTCEKIQQGMTVTEVTRILGRPCDKVQLPCTEIRIWNGSGGRINVDFGKVGVVHSVRFEADEKSVLLKFRRWLRLDPPPAVEGQFLYPGSTAETLPD
jgi:hypothetical protein